MSIRSALVGGCGELGLQVGPLLGRELHLAAEIVLQDHLRGVREVDRGAAALDAAQRDHALFGRVLLAHDDSTFLQGTPSCTRYCTDQELTGTSSCLSINSYNRKVKYNQYIDTIHQQVVILPLPTTPALYIASWAEEV